MSMWAVDTNTLLSGSRGLMSSMSTVGMGFDDAFSVFPIAWTLLFLVFLVHAVRTPWTIFLASIAYVSVQVWLLVGLVYGNFDMFLVRPGVDSVVRIFWLALGLIMIIIGAVHMQDWASMRGDRSAKPRIGFPKEDSGSQGLSDLFIVKLFLSLLYITVAAVMGGLAVATCALTLQDYDVFIAVLSTSHFENQEAALQDAMRYVAAYLWPSFSAASIAVVFWLSKTVRNALQERFLKLKFVFALVYVVLGVGTIIGAL